MAGGSYNSGGDDPIAEINVVPLVDIILVVLIIFMVTAPLVLKPTIDVNLPQASSGEQKKTANPIEVIVGKGGEVFLNGNLVSLEQLKENVSLQAAESNDSSVVLTADKDVTLDGLTTIIDTIKSSGIKKVGFSIQKK
jgi:biopolymer transport protein ExbD